MPLYYQTYTQNTPFSFSETITLSPELLIPGINDIPQNSISTLGIDKDEAQGNTTDNTKPGWFFFFKEVVSEVSFGLDVVEKIAPPNNQYGSWNDVDWVSIPNNFIENGIIHNVTNTNSGYLNTDISWGDNSVDMAYITYREPSMIAYHALNIIV